MENVEGKDKKGRLGSETEWMEKSSGKSKACKSEWEEMQ